MTVHGGDVWQVSRDLGIDPAGILDFSSNINPRGLPPRAWERYARDAANPQLLGRYPDPSASALRAALSWRLGVPAESIVIGPGAESLLSPALRSFNSTHALIPVPAFSEYRRICAQQEIEFIPLPLDRCEAFRIPVDCLCHAIRPGACVILNNPHNPTGAMLNRKELQQILAATMSAGARLLVDEAFIDYAPGATLVSQAASNPSLVLVRSLTKFYGCPALRVGYVVAHPDIARRIASFLPTWPVAQLAMDTLTEALSDADYAGSSLRENTAARDQLARQLAALGLVVFPSAANYLFLELPSGLPPASELRARLLDSHRILIRNCDSYEGLERGRYVRVAVRSASDNDRLVGALAAL